MIWVNIEKNVLFVVEKKHNIKIDLEKLPLDDEKTYELFSNGMTIGIFQFANSRTRDYLTRLEPKDIIDLSALENEILVGQVALSDS